MNDEQPPPADLAEQVPQECERDQNETERLPAPNSAPPPTQPHLMQQASESSTNNWYGADPPPTDELVHSADHDGSVPAPPKRGGSAFGTVREILETVVLALLIFLAVRAVVQNFRVEGSSMKPTFVNGQYVLVNKAIYARVDLQTLAKYIPFIHPGANPEHYIFHAPQRGDVIVFHPPWPNDSSRDFIKRVVAVPGDTVDVRGGNVYVNGALVVTPYIHQPTEPLNGCWSHITLRQNQYYVMGDNRGDSSDSRAWGPIDASEIVGKTLLVYWPSSAWKLAPNHSEQAPPAAAAPLPQTPNMNANGPARLAAFGCGRFPGG